MMLHSLGHATRTSLSVLKLYSRRPFPLDASAQSPAALPEKIKTAGFIVVGIEVHLSAGGLKGSEVK